jgi:hypothetical protein
MIDKTWEEAAWLALMQILLPASTAVAVASARAVEIVRFCAKRARLQKARLYVQQGPQSLCGLAPNVPVIKEHIDSVLGY